MRDEIVESLFVKKPSMRRPLIREAFGGRAGRPQKREQGQSLVELTIALFILVLLLAGIVTIGRALLVRSELKNAAEEGIVYGTSFPKDYAHICARITNNLDPRIVSGTTSVVISVIGTPPASFTCPAPNTFAATFPTAAVCSGETMQISITNDFKISMPLIGAVIGRTNNLIPISVINSGIILRPPCS